MEGPISSSDGNGSIVWEVQEPVNEGFTSNFCVFFPGHIEIQAIEGGTSIEVEIESTEVKGWCNRSIPDTPEFKWMEGPWLGNYLKHDLVDSEEL